MPYTCPLCSLDPYCHSLKKLFEKNETLYYYTRPSQAKLYYDVEGIVKHYDGTLSEIPENKTWVWIFDSLDFSLKHFLQTNVAIEIAKLISNKFSKNLKKIIIINPSFYISMTHKMITPFLNSRVREIIVMNYNTPSYEDIIL
jgi:hypothetical protein